MSNNLWRRIRIALFAAVVFLVLAVLARLFLPISTPQFRDAKGDVPANSIALAERWSLNGVEQSVVIRGRDASKSALIWVGDLWCETPALRHFNADLENHFLVVYWCPRYSGQSLDPFVAPPKTLTLGQYASDLAVLVDRFRVRFHKDKVNLVAHSSGTNYGLIYAAQNPDKIFAYVGVGQLADAAKNFESQREFALETARERHNVEAISELDRIGPPPFRDADLQVLRKWAIAFGGAFHAGLSYSKLALISAQSSEANWRDIYAFLWGASYTDAVGPEQKQIAFDKEYLQFGVPIYFLSGRYDHRSDGRLAQTYLSEIQAPRKEFVWFENSAHSPPFEEPDSFNAWIVTHLADSTRASGG
jgi:pimeloyl-ACP methyl ester carboxylesterase